DGRRHRRCRQRGVDRAAPRARLRAGRATAVGRLEAFALARRGDDAARAWVRRVGGAGRRGVSLLRAGFKSKTAATWIALIGGGLGLHRFYLHGWRDVVGWLHPLPFALG